MKDREEDLNPFKHLVSWFGAAAVILSLIVIYMIFLSNSAELTGGASLLTKTACPDGTHDPIKPIHFDTAGYDIFYRDRGCNAVSPQLSIDTAETLDYTESRLQALRLPKLRVPLAVDIRRTAPGGTQVIVKPGAAGAVIVAGGAPERVNPNFYYLVQRSAGELMLYSAAPGLNANDRRQLAAAYLIVAGPDQTARDAAMLASDQGSHLYAYLIAKYGIDLIPKALVSCRKSCDLEKEVARVLPTYGIDLARARAEFESTPAAR